MTNLTTIQGMIGDAGASINEFIGDNKTTIAGVGGGLAGVALGATAGVAISNYKSTKRKKASYKTKRKRTAKSRDRRFISKQRHEQAYQRRRKKLGKKTYGKVYKKRKTAKKARLVKGSKAAKAYMAKLRRMRK